MALIWETEARETRPHDKLDPVSAWMLRHNAPEAHPGGSDLETTRHVGVINRRLPTESDQSNPGDRIVILPVGREGDAALTQSAIDTALVGLGIADPQIFLLPLHDRSLRLEEDGSAARVVGAPAEVDFWPHDGDLPKAIVGVIDHGINIFHQRFQSERPEKTRLAYAWIQGGDFDSANPEIVPFGRELNRSEIATALEEANGDEDVLLRTLDADFTEAGLQPLAVRAGHGTHVLDLAAGMDPADATGDLLPIIAVNLPPEVARESTGSVLGLFFQQAFNYILQRARVIMQQLDTPLPVAINFSFGLTGGMRGGRHLVERAVRLGIRQHREILQRDLGSSKPVEVFIPAGNRNMARGHVASVGSPLLEATWQIQPGDTSSNHIYIRIEGTCEEEYEFRLSLTAPGAEQATVTSFTNPGEARILTDNSAELGRAVLQSDGTVRDICLLNLSIALAPSDPGRSGTVSLPPGPWGLRLEAIGADPVRLDAWILRDDTPPGFTDTGRQSYFIDPDYQERDQTGRLVTMDAEDAPTGIQRAGTLNAIATAAVPTVVGGVYGRTQDGLATEAPRPAPYSATPLPHRRMTPEQVDISAPSERSLLQTGVLAAGTRSGSRVALNGTSVAAPQVLRRFVDEAASSGDPVPTPEGASTQLGETVTLGTIEDQLVDAGRDET